ncbi:NADH-quinone oxidoreductase subunit J family protein [Planctomicrobium sp. SH527]|uniref:NADH-quinone oxidoreductase subunit J family protein n=1 Tax=Planctomicrobium sp. SH527 TaxID=3448123 RepID=UPI003F5B32FF
MEQILFGLYAAITCVAALAVVLSQNVVRMAFYLVVALGATAGLFFQLNADFVGATQLLIYVGGTVVLLIFGVMLTSSSPFTSLKSSPAEMLQGGFLAFALFAVFAATLLNVDWKKAERSLAVSGQSGMNAGYNPGGEGETTRRIGIALLGARFDRDFTPGANLEPKDRTEPQTLSTGYLLVFEIISMHLLVVLIGAAYLARAKHRRPVTKKATSLTQESL